MNDTDLKFGRIIKQERKARKWSQEIMGQRVGCTGQNISYYECGKRSMTLETFFKICRVLDLDPNEVQKMLD